jgi:hypothetical protein
VHGLELLVAHAQNGISSIKFTYEI